MRWPSIVRIKNITANSIKHPIKIKQNPPSRGQDPVSWPLSHVGASQAGRALLTLSVLGGANALLTHVLGDRGFPNTAANKNIFISVSQH